MKIAICAPPRLTYAVKIADVAQCLGAGHSVRFILGGCDQALEALLASRGLAHEVLLPAGSHAKLSAPGKAVSAESVFRDYFLPHAHALLPPLLTALERFKPDVVVSHLRDYAGATAAEMLGIPLVSFGSFASPCRDEAVDPPFGAGIPRSAPPGTRALMWRMHHEFNERVDAVTNRLLRRPYGLSDIRGTSTSHSTRMLLLSLHPALSNKNSDDPSHVRYFGSLFSGCTARPMSAEAALLHRIAAAPRPRVLVSLGTTYSGEVLDACLAALDGFAGSVIASFGGAPRVPRAPTRTFYAGWPFFQDVGSVIERIDAVVTVAAGQTVMDALARGVPVVCLPQQGEQREIALAAASAGAGLAPCLRRWDPTALAAAVREVACAAQYRRAAVGLGREIRVLGGAAAAARAICTAA